ncbi:hypothetical protein ACSBM8_00755 [Sphingomonas sp. ASY06-1R]|uniref:hypothetical protein n=1 Tax=Sphingomonas sp. ASY06-1R TaxID=3445771 RepID=UPI003FA2728E
MMFAKVVRASCVLAFAAAPAAFAQRYSAHPKPIRQIELSKPFGLPAGWQFVALQGDPIPNEADGGVWPAALQLCIRRGLSGACAPALESGVEGDADPDSPYQGLHYLEDARLVYPRGRSARPLLLVRASAIPSYNGSRAVITQFVAYDGRRFRRAYRHPTGHNMNQEVRYIDRGPLRGHVIVAEPTADAPFAYWVTVNALTPAQTYRQILRYRSATRYGDGNGLEVIDSEMLNIQRRLGVWRPGMRLPLPPHCPQPRLIRTELWCGPSENPVQ